MKFEKSFNKSLTYIYKKKKKNVNTILAYKFLFCIINHFI